MLQAAGNLSCCGALPHHRFPALTERPGASGSPLRQAIERPLPAIGLSPQTGPQGCSGWRTTACNGHMQGIGRPQRGAPAAQTGVGMAVLRLQFHQQKARREAQVLSDQTGGPAPGSLAFSQSERANQARIRLTCSSGTDRLCRNHTGALVDQQGVRRTRRQGHPASGSGDHRRSTRSFRNEPRNTQPAPEPGPTSVAP
jgi:hypothetical protein